MSMCDKRAEASTAGAERKRSRRGDICLASPYVEEVLVVSIMCVDASASRLLSLSVVRKGCFMSM